MSMLTGEQLGVEYVRHLFEVLRPVLKHFDFIAKLQYRYLILTIESRDDILRDLARGSDALCCICFSTGIEQENHVRGNMTDASDFLRFAIFQDQQIIYS